jgi:hypothetical protein
MLVRAFETAEIGALALRRCFAAFGEARSTSTASTFED